MQSLDRRQFLKGAAAVAGGVVVASAPGGVWARPASAGGHVRVYLVVVDGLRPDEVEQMPQLSELAASGTYFPQSRAQMVAETTPNHVSMLTGMRSSRHGMPGNAVPFVDSNVGLEPRYLTADSIFTLARRQAPDLRTASITAKAYLVTVQKHDRTGDGDEDATATNSPVLSIPVSDSAIDVETGTQAVQASQELDPDFLFLNLGDVDRMGHIDETGAISDGQAPVGRTLVLQTADSQIRRLVDELKADGRWDSTVFIVTADHSMDWSFRDRLITLQPAFEEDPLLADEVVAAANGGACMYALRSPDEPRAGQRLARMREIALATEGVAEALYIRPNAADGGEAHWVGRVHPDWGLVGDRTGDLVVTVAQGWRIGHGDAVTSNPIPGNHGHPTTLPIPVVISGGWGGLAPARRVEVGRELAAAERDPSQAENIDMAPTVAWLLGLNPPPKGYDGRPLTEAFTDRPTPRVAVQSVASLPAPRRLAGPDRFATAAELSRTAFPDGADTVVVASGEDFADALAAAPLAIRLEAPLLLAGRGTLTPTTAAEVTRLAPQSAIVVGGTAALGDQVVADLVAAGVEESAITRVFGPTRFHTAAEVARALYRNDAPAPALRQAILAVGQRAQGDAFADALSAGPLAGAGVRPILLTGTTSVPESTLEVLADLEIGRVLIAGGTAVVSQGIEDDLRDRGLMVERIAGPDRYETSRRLAERHIREGGLVDDVYLVSGARFPDALAAAATVGRLGGTLLLSPPSALGTGATRRFLTERSDAFVRINYVGGTQALTLELERDIGALLAAQRTRPA